MSRSSPLLQIKHLRRLMVGPVSFDVAAGECLCVSGSSGVGKSLLLRAIADLDPHEGEVWLDGLACQATDPSTWRHRVGLLPPESSWWLPCARDHFPEDQSWSLEALGLDDRLFGEPVARLSSGERQRFALLRLLANDPQVLLLDEPTANLDPLSAQRVEVVIAEYRMTRQAAVIWVSHDPAQIRRVADRQLRFEDGTLRESAVGRGT